MRILLLISLFSLLPVAAASTPVSNGQLLYAHWLDGSAGLDISGLSFCGDKLLAVSDKNSRQVYALELHERGALVPYMDLGRLDTPQEEAGGLLTALVGLVQGEQSLDFEGISCEGDSVYLLSERHNRLARITGADKASGIEWLPWLWSSAARARGYLQKFNAGGEGLVKVGPVFWVALEREPRGLMRIDTEAGGEPQFFTIPPVAGLDFRGRSEDVTGLAFYDDALFTLERNAFAVCRRSLKDLRAQWCIDYREIEEAPEFVYSETRHGKGEGLAVNSNGIYVVLDNNNVGRASAPEDTRALLLHFAFPTDGQAELKTSSSEPFGY